MKTVIKIYRNKRNGNKYIEVHNDGHYHNTVKDDIDLGEEISARFANASEIQIDELDFFLDLLDMGITLEDIRLYCQDKYEYSKSFMEEHGLI